MPALIPTASNMSAYWKTLSATFCFFWKYFIRRRARAKYWLIKRIFEMIDKDSVRNMKIVPKSSSYKLLAGVRS